MNKTTSLIWEDVLASRQLARAAELRMVRNIYSDDLPPNALKSTITFWGREVARSVKELRAKKAAEQQEVAS